MSNATKVLIALGVPTACALIYAATYLLMLEGPSRFRFEGGGETVSVSPFSSIHEFDPERRFLDPEYRFGGDVSHWLFWPANRIDAWLRPNMWGIGTLPPPP